MTDLSATPEIPDKEPTETPWPIDAECRYCDSRHMRAFRSPASGPSYFCSDCGVVSLGAGFAPPAGEPKADVVTRVIGFGNHRRHEPEAQRDIELLVAEIRRLRNLLSPFQGEPSRTSEESTERN